MIELHENAPIASLIGLVTDSDHNFKDDYIFINRNVHRLFKNKV